MFWPSIEESKRIRKIVRVLFANELGYLIDKLRLRGCLPFRKRIKTNLFRPQLLAPHRVLKVFEELDGSFIKLGQLLSLRPDLIPAEYCEELAKLQDRVPEFPGKDSIAIIESELKKPIKQLFSHFEEKPIAAASMGQVHLATLHDGSKVAVKVQRPNLDETLRTDIKLFYRLAAIIKKRYGTKIVNPIEIVHEFKRYTEGELNYIREAHNIETFRKNFEKSQTIVVPKVYWNFTTGRVLTMEYVPGRRLTDITKFKPATRKKIVSTIMDAELEQIFTHGVFHADPHPGNFLLKNDGKIVLLDFGIVGRIDSEMKDGIANLFVSMINADVEKMTDSIIKLGIASEIADTQRLRTDLYNHLSEYYGLSLEKIKMSTLLNDIIKLFRDNDLSMSPDFVLLAKATITIEGMEAKMNPDLDFVAAARPFVKRLEKERFNPIKIAARAKKHVDSMIDFAESIPKKTTAMLVGMRDADRDLRNIDKDLSSLTTEIDRSSNRLTLGFLAGTLFIASTIILPYQKLTLFGVPAFSLIGYVAAFLVLIAIFISIIREKKFIN